MPNDAKLGLVVGVGLVIAVAVLFFRKEAPAGGPVGEAAPAGIVRPTLPAPLPGVPARTTSARPTGRGAAPSAPAGSPRLHTVQEGDTLFSLARWYYGDAEKFGVIYQANRDILHEPDRLPVGVELVIPEAPSEGQAP